MRRLRYFILLLSVYSLAKGQAPTLESSDAAYDQFHLKESHAILESMLDMDTISAAQKGKALRRLAHQDWKYFQHYTIAKERLLQADSLGSEAYETWMLLSRIEREAQYFKKALTTSTRPIPNMQRPYTLLPSTS